MDISTISAATGVASAAFARKVWAALPCAYRTMASSTTPATTGRVRRGSAGKRVHASPCRLTSRAHDNRVRMNSAHSPRAAELYVVDHVADAMLPVAGRARYAAYRNALLADEQDGERVVELLSHF